ncbi:MAG: hypothetical protein PHF11_03475 [Candidatus Omnitrophica bacterium]|nr:hypothetical protein [Candidatus Omnitrophota bacterium]
MFRHAKAVVFILVLFFMSGCETSKGVGKGVVSIGTGVGAGVGSAACSTADGVAKDSRSAWSFIGKLDDWIKENLW